MNIGLVFDVQTDPADERQAEFDPPAVLDALDGALAQGGRTVTRLGSAQDLRGARARLAGVDLVFNIAEGAGHRGREAEAPMLLELWGVPYAGSDPLALMMGLDKALCKQLAATSGIATPRWLAAAHAGAVPERFPLNFPVIVKPRYEGSGRGIDPGALVHGMAQLKARLAWLAQRCPGPALIEEFVEGGELTVLLIGNAPPAALPAVQRPLDPATGLSCHVVRPVPAAVDAPLELSESLDRQAREMAVRMFEILGCRDVARVDFRVDRDGRPQFLEINPLPSYDPEGSFGLMAECQGRTYAALVGGVVDAAAARLGLPSGAPRA